MKRNVALQEVLGERLAIVEVSRAECASQEQEQLLATRLAQLPQFRGVRVVLGVPHQGPLEATFSCEQYLCKAIQKIGWLRLPWKEIELPDQSKGS